MAISSKPTRWPSQRVSVLILATLLVLRSRALEIPKETLTRWRAASANKPLTPEDLLRTLQTLFFKEADGSKTLLVPYDEQVAKVCLCLPAR